LPAVVVPLVFVDPAALVLVDPEGDELPPLVLPLAEPEPDGLLPLAPALAPEALASKEPEPALAPLLTVFALDGPASVSLPLASPARMGRSVTVPPQLPNTSAARHVKGNCWLMG
jgi:hypothetical protein